MRTPRWLLLVGMTALAPLLVLFAPHGAQAADRTSRPPTARARALELFEQSAKAYRDGRFQEAIDLLVEARRIKPEPVLLYNIGRAYEALGNPTEAADTYAAYLQEDPKAPDRRAIEIRIATLRAQAGELDKARTMPPPAEPKPLPPEPAPPPPPPPPPPADTSLDVVPWVVTGVGVVGVSAGVALGLVAQSRHASAADEPGQALAQHKQDQAETFATGATIAFIAGAAVTAVGVGWLTVRVLTPAGVNVFAGPMSLGVRGAF